MAKLNPAISVRFSNLLCYVYITNIAGTLGFSEIRDILDTRFVIY